MAAMLSVVLLVLPQPSLADTTTALEGWQFDGNTRSSWDILWTCLSLILACTWTAVHLDVPKPDNTSSTWYFRWIRKPTAWFIIMLAPELALANYSVFDYWRAKKIAACCKAGQDKFDRQGIVQTVPPRPTRKPIEAEKNRTRKDWTLVHGFCIDMKGLVLRTKDNRSYLVRAIHAETLIEAGVIKYSDLKEEEIKARSKADSLGTLVTVLQSTWVTVNIVARAAYDLPISPLEFVTVAYVACGLISYALWWHKPKDMETAIPIFLPYNHDSDEMPPQLRDLLDAERENFKPRPALRKEHGLVTWHLLATLWREKRWDTFKRRTKNHQPPEVPDPSILEEDEDGNASVSLAERIALDSFIMFIALLFSGIHIAA